MRKRCSNKIRIVYSIYLQTHDTMFYFVLFLTLLLGTEISVLHLFHFWQF